MYTDRGRNNKCHGLDHSIWGSCFCLPGNVPGIGGWREFYDEKFKSQYKVVTIADALTSQIVYHIG